MNQEEMNHDLNHSLSQKFLSVIGYTVKTFFVVAAFRLVRIFCNFFEFRDKAGQCRIIAPFREFKATLIYFNYVSTFNYVSAFNLLR